MPRHPVIHAALLTDPGRLVEVERARSSMLGLPPFGALAEVSGVGSDGFIATADLNTVQVGGDDGAWVARADDWMTLGRALSGGERPSGTRLRVAVDPPC